MKTFEVKSDDLWQTQYIENEEQIHNLAKLKNQMEFKFDSQKDHNEATGGTIIHLSNKQKQTQKEVDDHHKVH